MTLARIVLGLCFALPLVACGGDSVEPNAPDDTPPDEAPSAPGEVHLDPEAVQAGGIVTGHVERHTLTGASVISADVELDPARTAHVAPLVAGRLTDVRAQLGQSVHAGDVLASFASADAADLAAAIADARSRLGVADAAATRLGTLGESGVTSQRALLEAQSERDRAQAELSGLTQRRSVVGAGGRQVVALISPLDGVVVDLHAVPGETVEAGEVVFTVADTTHVLAVGRAPELAIAELREGLPATLRIHAYPTESYPGSITLLAPTLDEETRTLRVLVSLQNDTGHLRAGLFGSLEIGSGEGAVLTVPDAAIARIDGAEVVFVPGDEAGAFRAVPIVTGHRSQGLVEVQHGLAEGDALVTAGAFTLKSELLADQLVGDD